MFIEPHIQNAQQKSGWIEVIAGSMFSGKTEELIRRVKRAKIAKQTVQLFKPSTDVRYHEENIISHNAGAIDAISITQAHEILSLVNNTNVVGIDELQFFDKEIVEVCVQLANNGIRVICAGLDMDFEAKPFGMMPDMMAIAEFVTKVHAICIKCGAVANYSYRKNNMKEKVLLGETETYEARCRNCFYKSTEQNINNV